MKLGMEQRGHDDESPLEFREAAPSASSVASMIGTKNLLIIIVTMPFVFLVVVMAIIALFGGSDDAVETASPGAVRSVSTDALEEPAANAQRVVLPLPAATDGPLAGITLPAGAEAGAISLDGDRLAVRVESDDGAMIVIYDLTQNTVVQTVPITTGDER
ncbi:MAG: hypothetical protein AAF936_12275 [Pseudomonadota bacterium]